MSSHKPSPTWTGDPSITPQETITMVDIIGVGSSTTVTGNTPDSVVYTLGVAYTGETYTQDAIAMSPPGLMSIALPPGTIDSSGNFTPATTSATAAQAICYARNDQYTVLGIRDVRTQPQAGNLQSGDTCLYGLLGSAAVTCKGDSSVNLTTNTNSNATGQDVQFSVTPSGLYYNAPWGSIAFDAAGFRVTTSAGASFTLMGSSNPTASTQCFISASCTTISSGLITLGNPINAAIPLPVVYGVLPAVAPGIPIIGAGVGLVTVAASASTTVFVGI